MLVNTAPIQFYSLWLIAGIIAPIPLFHLWLHALLPWWRKYPALAYFLGGLIWVISIVLFLYYAKTSVHFSIFRELTLLPKLGYILMLLGAIGVATSIITLGLKRFFVWAVLRPNSAPHTRIGGIFRFIPHPAYFGYLVISLGMVFVSSHTAFAIFFAYLFVLTPIVIWLEEEELKKRAK